jgi:hypothetical protein
MQYITTKKAIRIIKKKQRILMFSFLCTLAVMVLYGATLIDAVYNNSNPELWVATLIGGCIVIYYLTKAITLQKNERKFISSYTGFGSKVRKIGGQIENQGEIDILMVSDNMECFEKKLKLSVLAGGNCELNYHNRVLSISDILGTDIFTPSTFLLFLDAIKLFDLALYQVYFINEDKYLVFFAHKNLADDKLSDHNLRLTPHL